MDLEKIHKLFNIDINLLYIVYDIDNMYSKITTNIIYYDGCYELHIDISDINIDEMQHLLCIMSNRERKIRFVFVRVNTLVIY